MNQVEVAILCTLLYSDIFNCPLTIDELHYYLIASEPIHKSDLIDTLKHSDELSEHIAYEANYLALKTSRDSIAKRLKQSPEIEQIWQNAVHYGEWFSHIPFVRMVALTGAVAARNPSGPLDDYDYMLVTEPGRVWISRAMAIFLVRAARLRGVHLCPNLVVDSDHLYQKRQDLYVAREIAQMMPLFGLRYYLKLREQNEWTAQYLPNARPRSAGDTVQQKRWKSRLETFLSGRAGDYLERWEYQRKIGRFTAQASLEGASAEIDRTQIKGHFQDHGHPILAQYHQRLRNYNLIVEA